MACFYCKNTQIDFSLMDNRRWIRLCTNFFLKIKFKNKYVIFMLAAASVKKDASHWCIHIIVHLPWKFKRTLHEKLIIQKTVSMASEESWTEHSQKSGSVLLGPSIVLIRVSSNQEILLKRCAVYILMTDYLKAFRIPNENGNYLNGMLILSRHRTLAVGSNVFLS